MRSRLRYSLGPVLLLAIFLGLLLLAARSPFAPLREMSDRILSPLENFASDARVLGTLQKRNAELRYLATELALENFYLKEYRYENQRLRRLLGFLRETPFRLLPARLESRSASRSAEVWRIDKGSADGIRGGMAVINHRGLVGRIDEVDAHASLLRTLRNPDVRVSAVSERTRVVGILSWQPRRGFRLLNVPNSADVEREDRIVTSGLGGIFPPGLPLGSIRWAKIDRTRVFQEVWVAPEVDFSLLEEVYVVLEGPLASPPEGAGEEFLEQGYFEEIPPPEPPPSDSAAADSTADSTGTGSMRADSMGAGGPREETTWP